MVFNESALIHDKESFTRNTLASFGFEKKIPREPLDPSNP